MKRQFVTPAMKELCDQQVRYAPRAKRLEQIDRAERLLQEIEPDRTYPYEYICYRLTTFRPTSHVDVLLSGADAVHDLHLFVEDLSASVNLQADAVGEKVLTMEELSKEFNVSLKTIARWRQQGLVSRRFVFDGRQRVGFLQSSVDRFVHANEDRVRRGSSFRQLDDVEREQIIQRSRRLANVGGTPSDVIRRVAKHMGRSPETVRYTIKAFEQAHPDLAIFADRSAPLSEEAKQRIFDKLEEGVSVAMLARRHGRTRSSIYRVAREVRAKKIAELPLDYMANEEFTEPDAEQRILADPPMESKASRKSRAAPGLPPYLASLYELPLLTREQEAHLFRKYNYLKFKASQLRERLDLENPVTDLMDEIEEFHRQSLTVKNEIIRSNLRLVVSIAKRHVGSNANFFELVSDGNVSLMRAVEKFDYSRGNKFSTYATWAIVKNFARTIPGEHRQRERFRTSQGEVFDNYEEYRTNQRALENEQSRRERQISRILEHLNEREQQIIVNRFGLSGHEEPRTLKQVGEILGVTKERVRQIEARAMNKLRLAAAQEKIDAPADE